MAEGREGGGPGAGKRAWARSRLAGTLGATALYVVLTILLTWPMAFRLHLMDAGDAAFFAWEIGWELHALSSDPRQLPHGNIFHPLRFTLGMDEPVLGTTVLVAPLWPFTHDTVWLFNVVRLLTFVASALSAGWLCRAAGASPAAALLGGAAFAFSPIRTDQIAHLSTLGTQWLPLVLLFAFRFFRGGAVRDAFLSGLFLALSGLACGYHALVGLAVLPPFVLVLVWGRWRLLGAGLVGVFVAGLGLLPVYLLHQAALAPLGYVRGHDETVLYSTPLEGLLATGSWNLLYGDLTAPLRTSEGNKLFPGLVLPALVLLGAVRLVRERARPSREAVALAVLAAGAVAVALGPEVRLFERTLCVGPFGLAREAAPVFQMIRVPARAGVFLALPLAVLAAKAISRLAPPRAVLALVGVAALAETVIAPVPMPAWAQAVDTRKPVPPVYRWLAEQPGDFPVVELPMLDIMGTLEDGAHHESVYMVQSTRGHWKRLVNGYAGIEPTAYVQVRELARRFPSAASLEAFRGRGVRYVILHRAGYGPNKWARISRDLPAFQPPLREVARFGDDIVFALGP